MFKTKDSLTLETALQDTAVAILNWNGRQLLEQFLPSVVAHTPSSVVVIDNGSTDDSIAYLQQAFPTVDIIALDKNYGFSEGYNLGVKQLKQTYVVLLNSDVEVTPNWLHTALDTLISNTNCAAVQPAIHSYQERQRYDYAGAAGGFIDSLGFPYCRGRIFDSIEPIQPQYEITKIDWATGAAMLTYTKLYQEVGGLDPRFFAHMEEIDLCARFKRKGYDLMCNPQAVVYHLGGGTLSSQSAFKTFLNHRNNLLFIAKNLVFYKAFPLIFTRLCLDALALAKYIKDGEPKKAWAVFKSHFSFYFLVFTHYLFQKKTSPKLRSLSISKTKRYVLFHFLKPKQKRTSN